MIGPRCPTELKIPIPLGPNGIVPKVGLIPNAPLSDAGRRIDPAPSEAVAMGANPAATAEAGRARQKAAGKREDRLESSGKGFLEAVARGYRELARTDESVRLVDARGTPLEVHTRVREVLRRELPETFAGCED